MKVEADWHTAAGMALEALSRALRQGVSLRVSFWRRLRMYPSLTRAFQAVTVFLIKPCREDDVVSSLVRVAAPRSGVALGVAAEVHNGPSDGETG